MGKDAAPQVGQRPLPNPADEEGLCVGAAPNQQHADDVCGDDEVEHREVAGDDPAVNRFSGKWSRRQ
uniref:Unannotated protein n=1 Tax=freshwater metagenome TaxID=449393 RepID=A0A6J6A6Q0_9ZZZZ